MLAGRAGAGCLRQALAGNLLFNKTGGCWAAISHGEAHLADERFQPLAKCVASADQPRLDRAQGNLQDLGNLFVGEAFNVAQDYGGAVRLRYLLQLLLYAGANLLMS